MLSEAQNVFREKKSTSTATQNFFGDIQKPSNNPLVIGIFLDLTKVFDVVNHKLLLPKLELCGLRGKIHSWMSSYLISRTQFVEVQQLDDKTSNIKTYT
jgi:hypothetical protein